ncbi:tRNA lysidine(34) synthetase TilS [uncultured Cetobacterium sp.]|uniref:tRNA lysidine(34) synthetase TilS n=1 Tax=uncultured Cetobacterium sp. TaxID=527638 RepID=UPI00261F8063|nr:tRNA lysidine(34) synthetase TilS [uncultured Cetobacterium sp.]
MLNKILKKIRSEQLIEPGDKIVVGFSGGPDSVFLLQVLIHAQKEIEFEIVLVHINHLLRDDNSEKDQEFSAEVAEELNLPIFIKRASIEKISKDMGVGLEEAGRKIRYDFFNEILNQTSGTKIAIAHNLDDQIETFLFRMIRGCSLEGLEGINHRDNIIRPINEVYKKDILNYLDANDIGYRVDETNFENEFTRNSIRLDLIPYVEKRYNGSFKDKVHNLIDEIREVNQVLKVKLSDYKDEVHDKITLNIELMRIEPPYIQRKIINEYLKEFGLEATREKILNIIKILNSGGSKTLNLENNYILKKQYSNIWIEKQKQKEKQEKESIKIKIPFKINFKGYSLEAREDDKSSGKNEFLTDLKLGDEIEIRAREDGDRMQPLGMSSYKKLKDIFINEKIVQEERGKVPIILKEKEIVWVAGVKKSEVFKGEKNKKGIKLIMRRQDEN